jgi:dCTP deaminase
MAQERPWRTWIPGVLSKDQIRRLADAGFIESLDEHGQDESSFDLTITGNGYEVLGGSVKPTGNASFIPELREQKVLKQLDANKDGHYLLRRATTYVFEIAQRILQVSPFADADMHGQATARSSVGRVDVLARLIVDGMGAYEYFDPDGLRRSSGRMYLEVTPLSFDVLVKPGIALTQLRLFYGRPEDVQIRGRAIVAAVMGSGSGPEALLSANLDPAMIGGLEAVAQSPRKAEGLPPVPLWKKTNRPDPSKYWRVLGADRERRFTITKADFFILRSKERIWIPPGVAVYCRATDETMGEMRIHYAGFVHPSFGYRERDQERGAPLIFEIRGHDFDVALNHGERLARLTFYRMSEDTKEVEGSYSRQELDLSVFFGDWPARLKRTGDGGEVEIA